ncbi:DUF1189 domain-containing protein [Guptibacillus hwajinpoensis]|uniref:DUF1189 domain-containing protein n=1 Tax=Guptibacillus hwajinpoensis TaxID=208199 RepID=A0A0J6CX96_9BACL|nr:DUF1189 domain-containing protein [Alkalihalobacillus macyae]KMM37810.1 hypothetical protein AB986_00190 [Alkalihalobacillus macyae]
MNVFKQLYYSLYSPKMMARFRFQKLGKPILYVFLLMLLTSVPVGIITAVSFTNAYDELKTYMNEVPEFTLEDGKLTSEQSEPLIRNRDGQTFIFDSTGETKPDDALEYDAVIAFLEDRIVVNDGGTSQEFDYSNFSTMTLTKQDVSELSQNLDSLLPIFIPLLIFVVYLFQTGLKFIGITVLATIGLLLRSISKRKVSYKQLWVLSVYAVTIPTVFFAIMATLKTSVPLGFLLYWFIAIMLLYLTIKEIPLPKKRVTNERTDEVK